MSKQQDIEFKPLHTLNPTQGGTPEMTIQGGGQKHLRYLLGSYMLTVSYAMLLHNLLPNIALKCP